MKNKAILTQLKEAQNEQLEICPICGTNKWEYFGGRYHFGFRLEYWICPTCTLVGQSPKFNDAFLPEFYSNYYRDLYGGNIKPTQEEFEFQKKRGRNLLEYYLKETSKTTLGSVLDFGCSTGGLLDVALHEFKAPLAVGIELDNEYSSAAKDHGIDVYTSIEELERRGYGKFDLITISHVLEHLSKPALLISKLSNLLKDDGVLCIEVPHSSGGACFQIAHLWGFNEFSLSWQLSTSGFKAVSLITHGYPRNPEKPNSYLVAIAQKNDQAKASFLKQKTTAHRERKKRYLLNSENANAKIYYSVLIKNAIKQLLTLQDHELIANSFFPRKLNSWKENLRKTL